MPVRKASCLNDKARIQGLRRKLFNFYYTYICAKLYYINLMKEEFITYLWKHRLIRGQPLLTFNGERIDIVSPGQENRDGGPDFLAAKIRIGNTLWAGNVEIHVSSSAWFTHRHDQDDTYNNVILHVVYLVDKIATNKRGESIHHLEVQSYIDPILHGNYRSLEDNRLWIPCQKQVHHIGPLLYKSWLNRLLICRLERKTDEIMRLLQYFNNHWEHFFLFMLCRYLGGKANTTAFGLLIQRLPFHTLARNHDQLFVLEALLFGQAGLLENHFSETYPRSLKKEYHYLRKKYDLPAPLDSSIWKYAKMRPASFPDVRIAQLARLVNLSKAKMFKKLMGTKNTREVTDLLSVNLSGYWNCHYRLNHGSAGKIKSLGRETIHTIIINALLPVLFVYGKQQIIPGIAELVVDRFASMPPENNRIIRKWCMITTPPDCSAESQGLLELYNDYCTAKKCLQCAWGHAILRRTN